MGLKKHYQSMGNRKVAIIGAGFVGASIAYALTIKELADEIVLIDKNKAIAQGESFDIRHGISFMGTAFVHEGDYEACADCNLIVITAGRNRKIGETRLDLADDNITIAKEVCDAMIPYYNGGIIMVISNPVDIVTTVITDYLKLPSGRVFSTGCLLDTSRLRSQVADYVGLKTEVVGGFVAGEHGEGQIPIWSRLTIAGSSMEEYCESIKRPWNAIEKEEIEQNVKKMGSMIIQNKGRTHYGIATCVCSLADAILNRRPTVACVSSVLEGEYGISGIALSLPSIIDDNGIQKRLEEKWHCSEIEHLKTTADRLKEQLVRLKNG